MGLRSGVSRRGRKSVPASERESYNKKSIEKALKWRKSQNFANLYNSLKKDFSDVSPTQCLELKDTESLRGWGVFATKPIKKGELITPYRGVILTKKEYDAKQKKSPAFCYAMNLPRRETDGTPAAESSEDVRHKYFYAIDADPIAIKRAQKNRDKLLECTIPCGETLPSGRIIPGGYIIRYKRCPKIKNIGFAAFVNHACEPYSNCEFVIPDTEQENCNSLIWLRAKKDIKKGEELTVDYRFDSEPGKKTPKNAITCHCGEKCRHLDMTPFIASFSDK